MLQSRDCQDVPVYSCKDCDKLANEQDEEMACLCGWSNGRACNSSDRVCAVFIHHTYMAILHAVIERHCSLVSQTSVCSIVPRTAHKRISAETFQDVMGCLQAKDPA